MDNAGALDRMSERTKKQPLDFTSLLWQERVGYSQQHRAAVGQAGAALPGRLNQNTPQ